MKLFTDSQETSFYSDDSKVKGLHEIEINSIHDYYWKYSLDVLVLFDCKVLATDKHNELHAVKWNENIDVVEIDFVKDLSYQEIFMRVFENGFTSNDEALLKDASNCITYTDISDDENEIFLVSFNDSSSKDLKITIDENDNSTIEEVIG